MRSCCHVRCGGRGALGRLSLEGFWGAEGGAGGCDPPHSTLVIMLALCFVLSASPLNLFESSEVARSTTPCADTDMAGLERAAAPLPPLTGQDMVRLGLLHLALH